MPQVVAVIPTLGKDLPRLKVAISSARKNSQSIGPDTQLKIVVVNNSPSATLPKLTGVDEVITPGLNLGYVGALELIRRSYNCDYVWSVQDDMVILNDVLSALVETLEANPRLAAASPVLIRDGKIPAKTRAGIYTNRQKTEWKNVPETDVSPRELRTDYEFAFVSGSGALFRKSALDKVGGFNLALYPLMHVDVEVCARFLQAGYELALVPEARIDHVIQGSTPRILGELLDRINRPIVATTLRNKRQQVPAREISVDVDIVQAIAEKSSYLFVELAILSNEKLAQSTEQLARTREQNEHLTRMNNELAQKIEWYENSLSWRFTRPLRKLRSLMRKSPRK